MKRLLIFGIILISISCQAQRNPFKSLSEKDGKIGIGTTAPDELLTVKGTIHTQEVLVDLNGAVAPDYVFENYFGDAASRLPEYQLPSLQELEGYVSTHYHLPGIPSAAILETEGVELKQISMALLEKIEELTLYTIQQQKEIESLKKKVAELENK